MLICIDPGHGGKDPGAIGRNGTKEKDITLSIALALSTILKSHGHSSILTRSSDITVSLDERVRLANKSKSAIFISIHLNSFSQESANGTETYAYSTTSKGYPLANNIQKHLVLALKKRDRGVKISKFYVVRKTVMPAVLVELLFISNEKEEAFILRPENQIKAANAIYEAISETY